MMDAVKTASHSERNQAENCENSFIFYACLQRNFLKNCDVSKMYFGQNITEFVSDKTKPTISNSYGIENGCQLSWKSSQNL